MDVRAGIDAKGNLVAFDFTHFYPQYRTDSVQTNAELSGTPLPAVPSYAQRQLLAGADVQRSPTAATW